MHIYYRFEKLQHATTHHDVSTAILGSVEGEKAKRNRISKMKTGTKRSNKGGGGRGGNTNGSNKIDKVRRAKTNTE